MVAANAFTHLREDWKPLWRHSLLKASSGANLCRSDVSWSVSWWRSCLPLMAYLFIESWIISISSLFVSVLEDKESIVFKLEVNYPNSLALFLFMPFWTSSSYSPLCSIGICAFPLVKILYSWVRLLANLNVMEMYGKHCRLLIVDTFEIAAPSGALNLMFWMPMFEYCFWILCEISTSLVYFEYSKDFGIELSDNKILLFGAASIFYI